MGNMQQNQNSISLIVKPITEKMELHPYPSVVGFTVNDRKKEYDRNYYIKNREKVLKRSNKYYSINKEKQREYRCEYRLKKRWDGREEERKIFLFKKSLPKKIPKKRVIDPEGKEKTKLKSKLRLSKINISFEDYQLLVSKQNGLCAICGEKDKGRDLAIDHCHKTGRVRGLLCQKCNRGIGCLHDDPELLRIAYKYLITN